MPISYSSTVPEVPRRAFVQSPLRPNVAQRGIQTFWVQFLLQLPASIHKKQQACCSQNPGGSHEWERPVTHQIRVQSTLCILQSRPQPISGCSDACHCLTMAIHTFICRLLFFFLLPGWSSRVSDESRPGALRACNHPASCHQHHVSKGPSYLSRFLAAAVTSTSLQLK